MERFTILVYLLEKMDIASPPSSSGYYGLGTESESGPVLYLQISRALLVFDKRFLWEINRRNPTHPLLSALAEGHL